MERQEVEGRSRGRIGLMVVGRGRFDYCRCSIRCRCCCCKSLAMMALSIPKHLELAQLHKPPASSLASSSHVDSGTNSTTVSDRAPPVPPSTLTFIRAKSTPISSAN